MLTTNNEEKKNKVWELATAASIVLVFVITCYFLTKMFAGNPLEGVWLHEDSDMILTVEDDQTAVVEWTDGMTDSKARITMRYSIDKELKTFAISADETAIKEAVELAGGELTEDMVRSYISTISANYDYNVENATLTLTDREYGEQLVFDKQ